MTTMTSLFARLVLALTLATGAGAAMAVPTSYHFTINTAKFGQADGYLDLSFIGLGTAGAATAVVSNFTGGANEATQVDGTASGDLSTSATLIGSNYNYVDQLIHFGGFINFDVLFDFADTGTGITFAAQFYDMAFNLIVVDGPFATVELTPGAGSAVNTFAGFVSVAENVSAVPEPGQWLLMLTGLLLLGAMARRRSL